MWYMYVCMHICIIHHHYFTCIYLIYSFDKNYQYRYGPQTRCKQSVLPTCRDKKCPVKSGHDLKQDCETVVAIPRFPGSSYFSLHIWSAYPLGTSGSEEEQNCFLCPGLTQTNHVFHNRYFVSACALSRWDEAGLWGYSSQESKLTWICHPESSHRGGGDRYQTHQPALKCIIK